MIDTATLTVPRSRRASRVAALLPVALDTLGRLALAALVAFHGWLLWGHVVDGRVFDPPTAARWAVSVLILLGFRTLRRSGHSLFWGRRAVGLWLVVVLLHCAALAGESPQALAAVPQAASAVTPFAVPAGLLLGAFLLAFLVVTSRAGRPGHGPWRIVAPAAARPAGVALLPGSPRAPPVIVPTRF